MAPFAFYPNGRRGNWLTGTGTGISLEPRDGPSLFDFVFLLEFLDPSSAVDDTLFLGVEGVARGTYLDMEVLDG
jgi:hypothetical protein